MYSKIISLKIYIDFSSKDINSFLNRLKKLLIYDEHNSYIHKNVLFFSRHRVSKNDISDKIGVYRRVQYKGECSVYKENLLLKINFKRQFLLVYLSLVPPLSILLLLYDSQTNIYYFLVVYFLISTIWFLSSKYFIYSKIKKLIIKADTEGAINKAKLSKTGKKPISNPRFK